jgi:hypothetical protein
MCYATLLKGEHIMKNLQIKNKEAVQKEFLGNGAIYHGYAQMSDNWGRVYTKELCDIEADRAADMRLKLARTFYTWWAWDAEKNEWNWENQIMKDFYAWLKRMKDRNISVILNTGWCSPGDLNGNGWTNTPPYSKCPFIVAGDWQSTVKNYGDWVSETVHQLIEVRGFTNIKILTLFTEAEGKGIDDPEKPYERWRDAVVGAHNALVRDNRRNLVKLMGPQEASIPGISARGKAGDMLKWAVENTPEEVIDIFSCHVYPFSKPIDPSYVKTGKAAITMVVAGGRVCRTIPLKPNTEYKLSVDMLFEANGDEPEVAAAYFGVFKADGRNDIHASGRSGVADPAIDGSVGAVKQAELENEYKTFELEFFSGDITEGVVGVFNDMRNLGLLAVEKISLVEKESGETALENGDFSNATDGWRLLYASGTVDIYDDWYAWCKQGMEYVPKNKKYVYDEYQTVFDKNFSRDSHGSDIVTAAVAFMNAGADFSLMWTLFDQQWPNNKANSADCFVDGDHRYGTMPVLTRTLAPHKSFYAFSLISRYVKSNSAVYEGIGGDFLHTTLAVSKDGEITVIVVNNKDVEDEFNITFENPVTANLRRYVFCPKTCKPTEKAERILYDKTISVTENISDKIAPRSVIVYTNVED